MERLGRAKSSPSWAKMRPSFARPTEAWPRQTWQILTGKANTLTNASQVRPAWSTLIFLLFDWFGNVSFLCFPRRRLLLRVHYTVSDEQVRGLRDPQIACPNVPISQSVVPQAVAAQIKAFQIVDVIVLV